MAKDINNKLTAFFKGFSDVEDHLDFSMASDLDIKGTGTISTGSYVLDDALGGDGGVPSGRVSQFYGSAGSGKSLLGMLTIKEAQIKDPTSSQMWIDSEGTFSKNWAEALGLDLSRIIIIEGDLAVNGRSLFTMLLGEPKEDARTHAFKGKSKEGFLDNIINKSFNVNVIVLDSLGAVIPPMEDTSSIGKSNMALMARFLSTTLKKLSLEVRKANVAFIIINHKRDSMNAYGSDHTFSGGNSLSHTLSTSIYFEAVQRKDATIFDDKENKIGQTVRAAVEKTKFGAQKKCEFRIHFGRGVIDKHEEIGALALEYDIVTKPTAMSYEYKDKKWVGAAKFMDAIKDDSDFSSDLLEKIKIARLNKWHKKSDDTEKSQEDNLETNIEESPKSPKSTRLKSATPSSTLSATIETPKEA